MGAAGVGVRQQDIGRRWIAEPRVAHNKALAVAELPHATLHGLRRSFGKLSEWVEVPVGVVAQIREHKPSAVAEKHYRCRPIDLLRLWHDRIEACMLEQARIPFVYTERTVTDKPVGKQQHDPATMMGTHHND